MKSQLARAELNVVGWRHVVSIPTPPAPGEAFSLHFCPNNSYSRNAVRVRNAKGENIGYVSDAPAAYFALLLPEASREVDGGQQWLALKPPKAPPLECALAFSFTFLRRDTYGDYVALLTVSQEPDAQALSAADERRTRSGCRLCRCATPRCHLRIQPSAGWREAATTSARLTSRVHLRRVEWTPRRGHSPTCLARSRLL